MSTQTEPSVNEIIEHRAFKVSKLELGGKAKVLQSRVSCLASARASVYAGVINENERRAISKRKTNKRKKMNRGSSADA